MARELDPQERLDWLRLASTETVGPVTFYALLRRFGSARAALDALPRLSRPVSAMSRRDAEAELAGLNRLGACLVCWGEPDYPATLAAVTLAAFLTPAATAYLITGIALLVILRHHENIRRLLAGTESRISFTKS